MLTRRHLLEAAGAAVALGGSALGLPQLFGAKAAGVPLSRFAPWSSRYGPNSTSRLRSGIM
jgi:hypothetical protein